MHSGMPSSYYMALYVCTKGKQGRAMSEVQSTKSITFSNIYILFIVSNAQIYL